MKNSRVSGGVFSQDYHASSVSESSKNKLFTTVRSFSSFSLSEKFLI